MAMTEEERKKASEERLELIKKSMEMLKDGKTIEDIMEYVKSQSQN